MAANKTLTNAGFLQIRTRMRACYGWCQVSVGRMQKGRDVWSSDGVGGVGVVYRESLCGQ